MTVLDPAQGVKPLDFGGDGITGSVDAYGRIIALNTYHPVHGYVTLTTAEPFPESERYNPAAVREYRRGLARLDGFGFLPRGTIREARNALTAGNAPISLPSLEKDSSGNDIAVVETCAFEGGAVQFCILTRRDERWAGRVSLQRCAYSQLTEGGPIPAPPVEMCAEFQDGVLTLTNPALGMSVAVAGFEAGEAWTKAAHGPIDVDIAMPVMQPMGTPVVLGYGFGLTPDEAREKARSLVESYQGIPYVLHPARRQPAEWWANAPTDPVLRRALGYGLAMCTPVGEGVCILTDHMLLPLAWNRDAYYVARALLSWRPAMDDTVRRHLIWTFEQAERLESGAWGRSYLANGRLKDRGYQLDQQLWPLVELAEYVLETDDRETLARLEPKIAALWTMLMARRDAKTGLFPTDETAADDPMALPYPLASHILFWRAATLMRRVGIGGEWARLEDELYESIEQYFVAERDGKRLYAYATDGAGRFHFYHDANDFPLVLAPAWAFCSKDDPVWRATIDFAFSEANREGFYQGHLGSVHTRAPWPLGDVQELIVARTLGDSEREAKARAALKFAAQWDGALPEAYDAETGAVVSRTWFAWPNAAYACVELGAFGV